MSTIQRHSGNLMHISNGLLVHGCNAQGVMGSGVANAVRETYPGAYAVYREAFLKGELRLGSLTTYTASRNRIGKPELVIVNAVTQDRYGTTRRHVNYEAVYIAFEKVAALARAQGLNDVHFPLIGCGLARGEWTIVAPIIEHTLKGLNTHLWVMP